MKEEWDMIAEDMGQPWWAVTVICIKKAKVAHSTYWTNIMTWIFQIKIKDDK